MNPELWRKVEELFHAALERAPEARQTFLDRKCGGDIDLRQEVELLLAKEKQAGSFLEVPALEDVAVTLTSVRSPVGRPIRPVSNSVSDRRWRHGRSVSRARQQTWS